MLGSFSMIEAVGVGSTGTVWRATQRDLDRTVAVKILAEGVSQDRLRDEARVLAALDHPNIVKLYDFVEAGRDAPGNPAYLAEEWVDGERLDEFVARLRPTQLTPEQALGVVRGALVGLAYAHERGLVHGDVSAGNILLDGEGTSKLIDFGLARPLGSAQPMGTPAFMSPEAAAGRSVLPSSDVYSSAAVLSFLLADDPGAELDDLLARSMDTEPQNRPPDAAAFLAELEEAAAKRYGAGWLARASVAGLVVTPVAGVVTAVAATGSGAAVASPAAAKVIIAGASADTGKLARRGVGKGPLLAAGAVAVIVGVVVAVVASSGGSDKSSVSADPPVSAQPVASDSPAASATPTQTPIPTPTVAPAIKASAGLVGKYNQTVLVTSSEIPSEPAGTRYSNVWTIAKGCTSVPCHIAISSSSGTRIDALFDGSVLTFSTTKSQPAQCVDSVTKEVVPGATAVNVNTLVYKLKVSTSQPIVITGTAAVVQTATQPTGGCELSPPAHEQRTITASMT